MKLDSKATHLLRGIDEWLSKSERAFLWSSLAEWSEQASDMAFEDWVQPRLSWYLCYVLDSFLMS